MTIIIALLWAGLILGVSFVATPVKFHALSLSLPVALEVGRVTFQLLHKIEIYVGLILFSLMTLPMFFSQNIFKAINFLPLLAICLLLLQINWLRPILDLRVEEIIKGNTLPLSHHHITFIVFEVIKCISLTAFAYLSLLNSTNTAIVTRSL